MTLLVPVLGALGALLLYGGLTATDARGGIVPVRRPRVGRARTRAVSAALGSGAVVAFVVAGLTGLPVAALVAGVAAAAILWGRARERDRKRVAALNEEWPDLLASLVSSVRAGISLPEGCADLATRGGPAGRPVFEAFATTYRATGSFTAGLERLQMAANDPVADRIAVSLQAAYEVGGSDLVPVLQALTDFVHQDLRIRKEIEARWSWNVVAARVAAAAPPLVLLLMITRPEGAAAFATAAGSVVILVGAALTALGYALMLRIARLPHEGRLR